MEIQTPASRYYKSLLRWYERFEAINKGTPHTKSNEFHHDDVLAFFVFCYHFKDWLLNDDYTRVTASDVEEFINSSEFLLLCAPLANGAKHLELDERQRNSKKSDLAGRHIHLKIGGLAEPNISMKWDVKSTNGVSDAFEVASGCMNEWKHFLQDRKCFEGLSLQP